MSDVLVINMQQDLGECRFCFKRNVEYGNPSQGGLALPVSLKTGEVVPDEYKGEWAGLVCCEKCYLKHRPNGRAKK